MVTLRSIFLMLFISIPAHATTNVLEQDVFDLGTSVKSLLLKYYHIQADEGNGELVMDLEQRLSNASALHSRIQQELGGRYLQHSQNTKQHWATFNLHLSANLNEIKESAYPELQVVTLMRESANAMVEELDSLALQLQRDTDTTLTPIQYWSRSQKRLLLHIVELYIERAASSMGAPLTIEGSSPQQLSLQFKQQLDLFPEEKVSAPAKRSINRIRSQWLFIEKSTNNQKAQLVPFLVMRYTDSILNHLSDLAA